MSFCDLSKNEYFKGSDIEICTSKRFMQLDLIVLISHPTTFLQIWRNQRMQKAWTVFQNIFFIGLRVTTQLNIKTFTIAFSSTSTGEGLPWKQWLNTKHQTLKCFNTCFSVNLHFKLLFDTAVSGNVKKNREHSWGIEFLQKKNLGGWWVETGLLVSYWHSCWHFVAYVYCPPGGISYNMTKQL